MPSNAGAANSSPAGNVHKIVSLPVEAVFLISILPLTTANSLAGKRSPSYGVLPEHYPMVGSTLLKAFSICLESAWTPNTEQAWSEAYAAVTELILSGAEYPAEILQHLGRLTASRGEDR